jgi:phenylalanyl-tRNA synthetase beta chain
MPVAEFERRLMMAGLNHESTAPVGDDLAIDLEVTSNRPDCLGHIGIAREAAVLFDLPLAVPPARPDEGPTPVEELVRVRIDCPDLCPRYTARVVRSLEIKPSPAWLQRWLATVGLAAINNVVDASNFVLMECGQPLHTFDYEKLQPGKGDSPHLPERPSGCCAQMGTVPFSGREIIVRRPRPGETIEAIDHKTYALEPEMCVIADARDAVAIAGVMGGAATEVSPATTAVLIESALFNPLSIRNTARRLNLHSDSSYRFERRLDPEGVDWASRRCCELILDLAGGELAAGVVSAGQLPPAPQPIVLRFSQLQRILGIEVPPERVRQILLALGNVETSLPSPFGRGAGGEGGEEAAIAVLPPSWRGDLSREIDLVEEVARVHGYDQIPEDASVPMVPSARTREDRVLEKVRQVLQAAGVDEAMTLSVVEQAVAGLFTPWTAAEPLQSLMPVLRGADRLRTSLVPSLLLARRANEALGNEEIELFEIARAYLPRANQLPAEERMLAITSGRDFAAVKGLIEAVVAAVNPALEFAAEPADVALLEPEAACRLCRGDQTLAYVGRLRPEGLKQFDLRGPTAVAEIRLAPLVEAAELTPRQQPQSPYPAVERDLNFVVAEAVHWADLSATVRRHGGPNLESLTYRDTYRDPERLGPGKKSFLLRISLRSKEGTLTSAAADAVRDRIVAACRAEHGAELRTERRD